MKISLNWMKRIVDFKSVYPDGGPSAEELADVLEKDGLPVEKMTKLPAGYRGLSCEDTVLDISVPKNRTDLLTQIWIAKEMCGVYHKSFKEFVTYIMRSPSNDWMLVEEPETDLRLYSETAACKMLCGRILGEVTPGKIPQDMKDELIANDLCPTDDVNDFTNYNMRYFGQPLFALDADRLPSKTLVVKESEGAGKICSGGLEYYYQAGDPLLTCCSQVLGIGGLLLDDHFRADGDTRNVLLLSYVFDRETARALSLRYGLKDLCSVLMSTGSNPQDVVRAVTTCTGMIYDCCSCGRVEPQDILNRFDMGRKSLMYTIDEINELLSANLTFEDICDILSNPELNTSRDKENTMNTTFPSYRQDNTVNDIAQSVLCYLGCDIIR